MKKFFAFLPAVLAPLLALLIMSFIKGDSLNGASSAFEKVSLGWPEAWSLVLSFLTGRIAFFFYGIFLTVFVLRLFAVSKPKTNYDEVGRSRLKQIGSEAADLIEQLNSYEQGNSNLIGMGILEYQSLALFYDHVFERLRELGITSYVQTPFDHISREPFFAITNYLAKVSIYCQNNKLEAARNVEFPDSFGSLP